MMKVVLLLLSVIAFALASDVVDLTNGDIDAALANNEFLLLELYAPWCGHCKNLAPEYEKAATDVKEDGIVLAKIDATADQAAGQRFGVKGYPTLIFFKNGNRQDYKGPRDAAGIAAWVRKKSLPSVQVLADAAAVEKLSAAHEAVVVGYVSQESDEGKVIASIADVEALSTITFAVAPAEGDNAGKIVIHRKFDDDVTFDGAVEDAALANFVAAEAFPYFTSAVESWQRLQATAEVILLICYDVASDEETTALGKAIAKELKGSIATTYAGAELLPRLDGFGLKADLGTPNAVIISNKNGNKFPFPKADQEFNAENVKAWVAGVQAGDVKPYFKSEPIPETNDAPVTVLVGDSFEDIVHAEGKDVLVEFYAPWCGHCKSLAPVYDTLGEHYANDDNVVIAKMDSTANDNTAVQIQGFPTLYFFAAGDKVGKKYESGRDLDSFVAFIDQNRVSEPSSAEPAAEAHDEL